MMSHVNFLLPLAVTVVAFLYASVGHGGASGYLALLSFFSVAPSEMGTSALLLNCLVSGTAFLFFLRAGHFSFQLTWPFLVASMPAAWVGGALPISALFYKVLLAATLAFTAFRLLLPVPEKRFPQQPQVPPLRIALPVGGGIGFLSGMVGIGGGIFLSPLLLLKGWASPRKTAAASSLFILANSVVGLVGRTVGGTFKLGNILPLVGVAFLGGLAGSYLGANHFSGATFRRLLAVILGVAVVKLIVP